jgi:Kdo2-lipid IVA lauroyltransferase/acyltransferase
MIFLLYFLQTLLRLVFWLPPVLAVRTMRAIARFIYLIARLTPIRGIVRSNYQAILPQSAADALADNLLNNISQSIMEVICFPFFRAEHFRLVCRWEGQENLDLALAGGKGVLLLTMHTGNYELMQVLLPHLGYRLNAVMKAPAGDPVFDFINRSRTSHGCNLINVTVSNMYREALSRLADNEIVGLLVDTGANESRNETVVFLGQKMPAAVGWLTLAQRSEAALVVCTCRRDHDQLLIKIEPPFRITADNRERQREYVRRQFDEFIRAYPDQWALFLNQHEIGDIVSANR